MVAVSGGVDSMVLLDMLAGKPGLSLTVAHFEHGIREDSDADRLLVEQTAKHLGLPFVCEHGNLGSNTSESQARDARYAFLRNVMRKTNAQAIITAHHQDDLIETAVINIIRGTGRKGLSSMASGDVLRPLLSVSKQQILDYAAQHDTAWHEDSTNQNDTYLRNYIRHTILPRLGEAGKQQFLAHIEKAQEINPTIDDLLLADLQTQSTDDGLSRRWFTMLPYSVSCEVMAAWLRSSGVHEFDRKTIERLVVAAKVAQPGKQMDINAVALLKVGKDTLQLSARISS